MKTAISTMVTMFTLASAASASTEAINGKTFYGSTDCGIAAAWPEARGAQPEIRDCTVQLSVTTDGAITYTTSAQLDAYHGFAQDVVSGGRSVTGLFFANLNGSYLPVNVSADGSTITDLNNMLTLTLTPPPASILLNRNFAGYADCGLADTWYLNDGQVHSPTGNVCKISLAFDGNGNYTYATDIMSDSGLHKGSFQQRGQQAHLSWDTLPAGYYYTFTIAADGKSLTLALGGQTTLTFKAVATR